jgi:endonuclease YncB( thermonuclease family)
MIDLVTAMLLCAAPTAHDGDNLRCRGVGDNMRIAGIDAPELGKCPRNRTCAPGDGIASRNKLRQLLAIGPIRYRVIDTDRYRRPVIIVFNGRGNVACQMIASGYAIYKPQWNGWAARC